MVRIPSLSPSLQEEGGKGKRRREGEEQEAFSNPSLFVSLLNSSVFSNHLQERKLDVFFEMEDKMITKSSLVSGWVGGWVSE